MSKSSKALIIGASIGIAAVATAAKAPKHAKPTAKPAGRKAPPEGYDDVQRDLYFDGPRGVMLERDLRRRID